MSKPKKKIGLVAKSIRFTNFSIIYEVQLQGYSGDISEPLPVICRNDIANKDLILKPTIIDKTNNDVIFTPSNVTPHFYQAIHDKTIRGFDEYKVEYDNIYKVGDVVGYVII